MHTTVTGWQTPGVGEALAGALADLEQHVREPAEVVRALTTTAAASLGAPGALGVAEGEPADLTICDGDPFTPGTRVIQTWIAGRRVWPPESADSVR